MSGRRKVLLVTGGSRGIGAAVVRLAAQRRYDICFSYRRAAEEAEAVASEARANGATVLPARADMVKEEDVLELFSRIDGAFGRLDGVVNNAGITGPMKRLADLERAELIEVLETNVVGAILVAREAVRRMSTRAGGEGGAIVNVSSRAARLGGAGEWIHYAASKGALDSLTVGLAREVGAEGIRVNAVSPGLIETEIHAAAGDPGRLDRLVANVPLGRCGSSEEVAEAILWLLSDAAAYVSGAVVPISGGR